MRKRFSRVFYVVIIFLFIALFFIGRPFDENELSNISTAERELGVNYVRTGVPHPALWYFTIHVWSSFFEGEFALRFLPLLFGIFSIIVFSMISEIFLKKKLAFVAVLLFALNPILFEYSILFEGYTMFLFFGLLSFYFFLSFIRNGKHLLSFFLSSLLLSQIHFYSMFLFLFYFLFGLKKRQFLKKIIFLLFLIAIGYLPQLFLCFKYGFYDFPFNEPWHDMIPIPSVPFFLRPFFYLFGGLGFYGISLLIIFYIFNKPRNNFFVFFVYIIPLIFLFLGFFINVRYYHLIFIIPFFYLSFFNKKKHFLIVFAIIILSFLGIYDKILSNQVSHDEISYFEANIGDGEYIISNGFYAFVLDSYSDLEYKVYNYSFFGDSENLLNLKYDFWIFYPSFNEIDRDFFNSSLLIYLSNSCEKKDFNGVYYCSKQ